MIDSVDRSEYREYSTRYAPTNDRMILDIYYMTPDHNNEKYNSPTTRSFLINNSEQNNEYFTVHYGEGLDENFRVVKYRERRYSGQPYFIVELNSSTDDRDKRFLFVGFGVRKL